MRYVVLQSGGKQYKVTEGAEIEIEKVAGDPESVVKFENILLYSNDGDFVVGQPQVSGVMVQGRILEQKKGEKIRVAKFKAKARYRKVTGHRQMLTKVKIEKIVGGKENNASKDKEKAKK
jgi:large subunit ribosomal protein L21